MKLELNQLAAYLPYGLKLLVYDKYIEKLTCIDVSRIDESFISTELTKSLQLKYIKPILRPIIDFYKTINHNDKKVNMKDIVGDINVFIDKFGQVIIEEEAGQFKEHGEGYWIVNQLISYHFDVFGLIEKGLAVKLLQ